MRQVHLKVKIKSLAAEARIIRHEETKRGVFLHGSKCRTDTKEEALARRIENKLRASRMDKGLRQRVIDERQSLSDHRRGVVRQEARLTHLAYGYLRGRPYKQMEAKVHPGNEPQWAYVEDMVRRFGGKGRNDINIKAWAEQP